MRIIDITRTAQDAPTYPGDDPISIVRIFDMQRGDEYNCSLISAGSHAGTHADAYSHFLPDSEVTIDRMELSRYYGDCRVMTVPENCLLDKSVFFDRLGEIQRLVLHTGGQSYIDRCTAEYFVASGIKTVITDALSIAPIDNEGEIHRILLNAGIAVVENVVLDDIDDGDYIISAFPIKYGGCDGAPVRAVLINK